MHATYIRPRDLPQLQNSTASQKQHSLRNLAHRVESSRRVLVSGGRHRPVGVPIVYCRLYGTSALQGNLEAWSKNAFPLKRYVTTIRWRPLLEAMK
jgi:hypothetical protein